MNNVQLVYGTGFLGLPDQQIWFPQAQDLLAAHGVRKIDTAQLYSGSEEALAKFGATERFAIDTKWRAGVHGPDERDDIAAEAAAALVRLNLPSVDIYYMHLPVNDRTLEELAAEVDASHKAGSFKRFGLSNFSAADVARLHAICSENGYVLPSVYQGNYSAIARKQETLLFPLLRKLGISFYAYSPLGGGFLTKSAAQVKAGEGRFDVNDKIGKVFHDLFVKPESLVALGKWEAIARDAGCSRAELGYRWIRYNSGLDAKYGDAVVIGAGRLEQLEQTLKSLEAGPLDTEIVKRIDAMWEGIKHVVVQDPWNRDDSLGNVDDFLKQLSS